MSTPNSLVPDTLRFVTPMIAPPKTALPAKVNAWVLAVTAACVVIVDAVKVLSVLSMTAPV